MIKHISFISIFILFFTAFVYANELKITSHNLEVDRDKRISIFTGNVYAYNIDIQIWSEKLIVKFNENDNKIQLISAENEVKIVREGITATGNEGKYNPNENTINMYGNVVVVENQNYVKSDELFLDLNNSTSIMRSITSKRVEAFIASE